MQRKAVQLKAMEFGGILRSLLATNEGIRCAKEMLAVVLDECKGSGKN